MQQDYRPAHSIGRVPDARALVFNRALSFGTEQRLGPLHFELAKIIIDWFHLYFLIWLAACEQNMTSCRVEILSVFQFRFTLTD